MLKAPADGHTLLLMSNATAVSVHLMKKLPFDVVKDLAPISTLGFVELGIAVPADSRFKTLAELLAHARAQPGKLTIGTITVGSTQYLSAELFKSRAGIEATVVPYKGYTVDSWNALAAPAGTPAELAALLASEIRHWGEVARAAKIEPE